MFCYQCEQASKGIGCEKVGVCGKDQEVAALQDLLMYVAKGLSQVALEGWKNGVVDFDVNKFTCEAVFSTLTNVDFDPDRFVVLINRAVELTKALQPKVAEAGGNVRFSEGPTTMQFATDWCIIHTELKVKETRYERKNQEILEIPYQL